MTEERYAAMQVRMHGMVADLKFAQQKFKEADEHFVTYLKSNPRDHVKQFRHGFSLLGLAAISASEAQMANNELLAALAAKPTDQAKVDAAQARQDAASKQALANRDGAVEALAKALAITGQYDTQAKELFNNAYKSKTGSLDGQEQLIAEKKKELGIQP
jgi:tetratricopeptide (TPR) repeat protein